MNYDHSQSRQALEVTTRVVGFNLTVRTEPFKGLYPSLDERHTWATQDTHWGSQSLRTFDLKVGPLHQHQLWR